MLSLGLSQPGPLTITIIFAAGLLTSLGPCALSLLPVTVAYLAGFKHQQSPLQRSIYFCSGIVLALIFLGSLSGLVGKIYGQLPEIVSTIVAIIAILMGLNLIGLLKIPLPSGPNPNFWSSKVPEPLAPTTAGFAFGLAASPCSTPVLAVLLAWISQSGNPFLGILFLGCFGLGQVIPLFIAGTAAATIPSFLGLRQFSKWIPPLSGSILLTIGLLSLLSRIT